MGGGAGKVPSPPASTTDFARFPEKPETVEVTSLIAADVPTPAREGTSIPKPSSEIREPELPTDVDPQIEIIERIGAGGMGEVFLARQKHLGRKVALKRIRDWGADAATRERFVHEAKAQSRLQHPSIAQVYDLRESGGALYLVMEYVEGQTLEQALTRVSKFPPGEIASIGIQLTEALEAAAHEGYIHRDLKPGNVMLTTAGKIKIIDFGLAILLRNILQTRFTEKGEVLGTPAYMSPEQLNQDEELDIRSDIWSLGVLLYALATGGPPFTGKDFVCTVKNVLIAEAAPLPELEPGFPPGLWEAIARALRKDRSERWQDYASFRKALQASAESQPTRDADTSSSGRPLREGTSGNRRPVIRRTLLAAGICAAALSVALAARYFPFGSEVPDSSARASGQAEQSSRPNLEAGFEDPARSLEKSGPLPDAQRSLPRSEPEPPPPSFAKEPPAKALTLREKLLALPLSEQEIACARDLLGLFEKHRAALLAKDFGPMMAELNSFERERLGTGQGASVPETGFAAAQVRSARRMVELAQGAILARVEELRQSAEPVTLVLTDGVSRSGVILETKKDSILLGLAGGGALKLPLADIHPESLKGQSAPGSALLALLSLAGRSDLAFSELAALAETRDDILLWLPIAVRLARLELSSLAGEIATSVKAPKPGGEAAGPDPLLARVEALARKLGERRTSTFSLFLYTSPDFEQAEREEKALRLLVEKAYGMVLGMGPGTVSFSAAAEILLSAFLRDLERGHDELHARTGWHGYGWRLFPPTPSLEEQRKYWDIDPEGEGTLLRAGDVERRVAMGKGAPRAAEGISAVVVFRSKPGASKAPQWRLLLRSQDGATTYLRFGTESCGLYRTRLEPGAPEEKIAEALLPPAGALAPRALALVPLENYLHVFMDGRHVMAVPERESSIPMQLSIGVTEGELSLRSVKVRKPSSEENNR